MSGLSIVPANVLCHAVVCCCSWWCVQSRLVTRLCWQMPCVLVSTRRERLLRFRTWPTGCSTQCSWARKTAAVTRAAGMHGVRVEVGPGGPCVAWHNLVDGPVWVGGCCFALLCWPRYGVVLSVPFLPQLAFLGTCGKSQFSVRLPWVVKRFNRAVCRVKGQGMQGCTPMPAAFTQHTSSIRTPCRTSCFSCVRVLTSACSPLLHS